MSIGGLGGTGGGFFAGCKALIEGELVEIIFDATPIPLPMLSCRECNANGRTLSNSCNTRTAGVRKESHITLSPAQPSSVAPQVPPTQTSRAQKGNMVLV